MYICVKPEILEHSAKGQTWKKHKYIEIRNGRYIYPEDIEGAGNYRQAAKEERLYAKEAKDNYSRLERKRYDDNQKMTSKRESVHREYGPTSDQLNAYLKNKNALIEEFGRYYKTEISAGNLTKKAQEKTRKNATNQKQSQQQKEAVKANKKAVEANKKAEQEAMKQVQAKQQQKRAVAKANKQAEASKRQSEQNQQSSRSGKKSEAAKKRNMEYASTKVEKMHSGKLRGTNLIYNRTMESGNVVDGNIKYENKIYRQSDVNPKAIMAYSKKYGFEKAVKEFGEKGKAFLLSIFGKK